LEEYQQSIAGVNLQQKLSTFTVYSSSYETSVLLGTPKMMTFLFLQGPAAGHTEVSWHPGQETNLASPCSNQVFCQ